MYTFCCWVIFNFSITAVSSKFSFFQRIINVIAFFKYLHFIVFFRKLHFVKLLKGITSKHFNRLLFFSLFFFFKFPAFAFTTFSSKKNFFTIRFCPFFISLICWYCELKVYLLSSFHFYADYNRYETKIRNLFYIIYAYKFIFLIIFLYILHSVIVL